MISALLGAATGCHAQTSAEDIGDADCPRSGACRDESCAGTDPGCNEVYQPWVCADATALCEAVAITREPGAPADALADPAAASCSLEALRDGSEGIVTWSDIANTPVPLESAYRVIILSGRRYLVDGSWTADAPGTNVRIGPKALPDAAVFQSCLDTMDAEQVSRCLGDLAEETCD
jgi:hypothetical protein